VPITTFCHMPPPSLDDAYADEWTQPLWNTTKRHQLTAPYCAIDEIACDMPNRGVWHHVTDDFLLPFWTTT